MTKFSTSSLYLIKLYVTESKIRHNCSNSVWLRACSTLISWKLEKPRVGGGGQVQEGVGRVRGACAVEQLTLGFFPTYHMSKEISKDISLNVGIPRKITTAKLCFAMWYTTILNRVRVKDSSLLMGPSNFIKMKKVKQINSFLIQSSADHFFVKTWQDTCFSIKAGIILHPMPATIQNILNNWPLRLSTDIGCVTHEVTQCFTHMLFQGQF